MSRKTVGITGGAGFVGRRLTELLTDQGYNVIIFTRTLAGKPARPQVTYAQWDADKQTADLNSIKAIDVMVHLAGEGIADKRWSTARKKEIADSRVNGTQFLVNILRESATDCKTLISASATGFYGPDRPGAIPFTENAPAYNDFLGDTCNKWEHESLKAADFLRTVIFRFGIVLGKEKGAFAEFEKPTAFGVLPILGPGSQVISWIEIDDLARLLLFALEHESVSGIYNAVAPKPVTNRQLMKTIAAVKGGIKIPVPVPAFALKIALGEMSEEVLKSCTVSAQKTLATGFTFQYPEITGAVKAILGKK
jgi:uncharacterized protein (TIGR01777 family)